MNTIFGMITTKASGVYTVNALRSFIQFTPEAFDSSAKFILIDNDNSFYASVDTKDLNISIIRNQEPKGFAHNVNQIIVKALETRASLVMMNNDLEFSQGWFGPLSYNNLSILSPLSNQQVPYVVSNVALTTQKVIETLVCHAQLNLDEYLSFPSAYQFMALSHVRNIEKGLHIPQIVLPYFCIKIPHSILQATGLFDERYGQGGGEDYDYSLRALLAGFETRYAADSYIFHFGGKSSWDGPESAEQREVRESKFKQHFIKVWGKPLLNFLLHEDSTDLLKLGITDLNPQPGQIRDFLLQILNASADKGEPLSKDWRN